MHVTSADDAPAAKAWSERTYSRSPFVHRIVLLDEDGTVIRPPKPGEEASPTNSSKPVSLAKTCGKCHSDYDVMSHGLHFNFSDASAPHGRAGEPWILTDSQTRTQLPLSYRGWKGTFHPYDVGLNDFNFAKLFGRHLPGGGALQSSGDLRFKMSGPLEIDCLICHIADDRYDAVARAQAISNDQNFRAAPTAAATLGKVTGQASRLRDNFDPAGPDAKRAPKVTYDPARFDDAGQVLFDIRRRVPNERCYFCHTNIDVGRASASDSGNAALESRWQHDRDIHLAKGMSCVDCHRHGTDHMMVRGYEGEYEDRVAAGQKPDRSIATLTCAGCHYGTWTSAGGRNAAPRPVHRGMPPIHFEKLACTACHSGPRASDAATLVQTSMSHQLGLPRRVTADAAAPTIQQPVFLRDPRSHKIVPNRALYPSFWARLEGEKLVPILPEQVAAAASDLLGERPDPKQFPAPEPLSPEQVTQILVKLAAAPARTVKAADAVTARGATTNPTTTAAATQSVSSKVVYVTGGRMYQLDANTLKTSDAPALAAVYSWPLAHDVRGAQQALGARGCTECHANGAPIFDSTVSSSSVFIGASVNRSMHELRSDSMASMRVFNATYRLRWPLIWLGYLSAAIVALVYLKQKLRTIGGGGGGSGGSGSD